MPFRCCFQLIKMNDPSEKTKTLFWEFCKRKLQKDGRKGKEALEHAQPLYWRKLPGSKSAPKFPHRCRDDGPSPINLLSGGHAADAEA